jgi:sugar/nucleoside kinase (ribokinase family)
MTPFVAVLGTVNRDVIVDGSGARRESLGGILYNAIALGALFQGKGISVRPIGRLGAADRREAIDILSAFPSIEADALIEDPAGTNLSILDYRDDASGDRVERVEMRVPPLGDADLQAARGGVACLVNMTSGRDVEREVLARFRAAERGLFVLDVQALARTRGVPRAPRLVPDFESWSAIFPIVRGSESEIAHFGGDVEDVAASAGRILDAGAREVIVTRAELGGSCYRTERGARTRIDYGAVPCARPVDPTGCGDTFLSGVCAARVLGFPADESLRLGAFVASRVIGLAGLEELCALRTIVDEAIAFEPAWRRYL